MVQNLVMTCYDAYLSYYDYVFKRIKLMILSHSIYVKVHFDLSSMSMVLSNMRQYERIQDQLMFK
jgi:hypothetical protein